MAKRAVTVIIRPCNCQHQYQDKAYGSGMRVHNAQQGKYDGWRCTVCGTKKAA